MHVLSATTFTIACMIGAVALRQGVPPPPEADYRIVDDFSCSRPDAQAAWRPMAGSEPVSVTEVGGKTALRMPCNFSGTKTERSSWDYKVDLDLTMCNGVQFLFRCRDTSPVASFSFYFHSGNGWYAGSFDAPATTGWSIVRIQKNATRIEGRPGGWANVDAIRISAWRGQDRDTEFYISALGLLGGGGTTVIVRSDSAAERAPNEIDAVRKYTDVAAELFDRAGVSYIVLSDMDLTAARLKDTKLVMLPHNPDMPQTVIDEIAKYLHAGGKLLSCYTLPESLEAATGIRSGTHISQRHPGYFASIRPAALPLPATPPVTEQASWNIRRASAVEGRSRVAAYWHNNKGQSTGFPAIVASSNCVYFTHVLIPDDPSNKLQLLLAMAGHLVPDLWREAAEGRIDRIGRLGPYDNHDSALRGIRRLAGTGSPALPVLEQAAALKDRARDMLSKGDFAQAVASARKARQSMIEAYCLAQRPQAGEHRAFWCHSAFGVEGMTWDEAVRLLAENGFTAVLPNMLWAGVAFYESDVLPVAPAVAEKGDQVALCLAACKKYGVECHVWKVNYNMGWATDKGFAAAMKAKGRTQVNYDGSTNDRWLCPSDPENQKLEIDSMLELARKYRVDGLHFDYIRYPDSEGCFCPGCRQRFEKVVGTKVKRWPADLRSNDYLSEQWQDFRRRQITSVVARVSERARKLRRGIRISAAVFRNWPVDRNSIGQDWKLWCDRGYLDFVCPMDYTASSDQFRRMVRQQLPWAGKVPCYPGIGLSVWPDRTDICKLIEQINITRELRTGGFTIFNYAPTEAREVLGRLGKGTTRKPPAILQK
jgi:uncharacterized lipoprotein YddW (UPF0748 family)